MIPVVGPRHPLAADKGPIPTARLESAVQIVLFERNEAGVADQAVLSPRTWRVADLHTKHAMLRANLGWGNLPEHLARDDLRKKKLIAIRPAAWGEDEHKLYLSAVYRSDAIFGPAHLWLLAELEALCLRDALDTGGDGAARRAPSLAKGRTKEVLPGA
jgi:DNA-binding transcriptional LysR family regulator